MVRLYTQMKQSDKFIKGSFEVVDGVLSFRCSTQGATFEEVEHAITKLRDECQRQLDAKKQCPFYKKRD